MRTLGLIGGLSWESTAVYYRLINEGVRARRGSPHSAPLVLWSFDFAPLAEAQHEGRWDQIAEALGAAARQLEQAGAEGVVLCTNTMHRVAAEIRAQVSIPLLHIADGVIAAARREDVRSLGLLGTRFTMEAPFLRDLLTEGGAEVLIPDEPTREEIHRVIYQELCAGRIVSSSRLAYLQAIASLRDRGAQAIVLGCTEIGMLVNPSDVDLPLLDTTKLHADRAIAFILGTDP